MHNSSTKFIPDSS